MILWPKKKKLQKRKPPLELQTTFSKGQSRVRAWYTQRTDVTRFLLENRTLFSHPLADKANALYVCGNSPVHNSSLEICCSLLDEALVQGKGAAFRGGIWARKRNSPWLFHLWQTTKMEDLDAGQIELLFPHILELSEERGAKGQQPTSSYLSLSKNWGNSQRWEMGFSVLPQLLTQILTVKEGRRGKEEEEALRLLWVLVQSELVFLKGAV